MVLGDSPPRQWTLNLALCGEEKQTTLTFAELANEFTGWVTDYFVTTDSVLVYPGYLRKLVYHEPWVKKYQIQQTEADRVVYRVVLDDGKPSQETIDNVTMKTQSLLGEEMTVKIEYVDLIELSKSRESRYTISDVVE